MPEDMNEVTRFLQAAADGQEHASERLLPLVYQELRRLAAAKMAREQPGQTLQATALVHEAYLRLPSPGFFLPPPIVFRTITLYHSQWSGPP